MTSVSPRRHRKGRYSIGRLSSDTTASLPVYSQSPHARSTPNLSSCEPADPPPQYQYEADADGESEGDDGASETDAVPPLSPPSSTLRRHNSRSNTPVSRNRRPQANHHRKRSSVSLHPLSPAISRSHSESPSKAISTDDPFLDALLARSVQALEVSNALLQSSMSTQTSLAALNANDSPPPSAGPSRVTPVPQLQRASPPLVIEQRNWMDDINEIESQLAHLLDPSSATDISRSLPTAVEQSPIRQRLRSHHRIRSCSSTDLRTDVHAGPSTILPEAAGELHFGVNPRSRLIAPAPRAITQYVECDPSEDRGDDEVLLPSTLGLRAAGHAYIVQTPTTSSPTTVDTPVIDGLPASSLASRTPLLATFRPGRPAPIAPPSQQAAPEARKQADDSSASSAVSLLSSFLSRRPSTSTSHSKAAKVSPQRAPRRRASIETAAPTSVRPISYHYQHDQTQLPHRAHTPSTPSSSSTALRPSRSPTPTRRRGSPPPPLNLQPTRVMTPPIEVSSPSPDSDQSSPSSDGPPRIALSVQALRKILTDQPPLPPKGLQPRTPVAPTVGTSHATASISRLFTRGTHMHAGSEDARIARRSALKQPGSMPSTPSSPVPPSQSSTTNFLGLNLSLPGRGSASSSGRSTPKRISFAALPEHTTGTMKGTRAKSRSRKRKGRAARDSPLGDEGGDGWWTAWLLGSAGGYTGLAPGEGPTRAGSDSRRSSSLWGRGFHGAEDFAV